MRFTVTWLKTADSELAEIWLNSSQRAEVTIASDVVERELANDPITKGAEVSEVLRSLSEPPLKAFFAVREDDRTVEVGRVVEI